ncbi:MAG TPA: GDSL-type esterase/lipase family protein [Polyangiaceae bacterium]|nr:GDSL-type esterase/lipase family protein [Polyangiaceae bacterium]
MSHSKHHSTCGLVNGRVIRARARAGIGIVAALVASSLAACSDAASSGAERPPAGEAMPNGPSTQPPGAGEPGAPAAAPPGDVSSPESPATPGSEGNPTPVAVATPEPAPAGNGQSPEAAGEASTPSETPADGMPPTDGTPPTNEPPPADTPSTPVDVAVGPDPSTTTRALCTGTDPIQCHFGGQPGNYDVTVVLGGPAAANTTVLAETRRTMLAPVATAAGTTRRFTFGVNVRQPEGEPIQAVPAGTPGLDLYFVGGAGAPPALESIGFRAATEPVVVYVAGDSTVADQTGIDYGGWAQQLPQHFDYPIVVANYADSGESSGSFLNARPLFAAIESRLTPKDWVLIQFGHNDKQVEAADFHDNITQLVTRVKAKGASPVLVTPVARAQFNAGQVSVQHINGLNANLPVIIRQVAAEQSVPLLDLTVSTSDWLREVGPNGWQPFHALGTDVTHTNDAGARVEAEFVRELIVEASIQPLVSRLR